MFEALTRAEAPSGAGAPELVTATRSSSPNADSSSSHSAPESEGFAPFENLQSSLSTPPTSLGDRASITSTSLKLEEPAAGTPALASRRSGRSRDSIPTTYNVKILAGTAVHVPNKYKKTAGLDETRRKTISGDIGSAGGSPTTGQKRARRLVDDGIDALDMEWDIERLPKSQSALDLAGRHSAKRTAKQLDMDRRKSTRSTGDKLEVFTGKIIQGKKKLDVGLTRAKRELLRLADTPEFAKIETKPVLLEVWSNGKLVEYESPSKKRKREAKEAKEAEEAALAKSKKEAAEAAVAAAPEEKKPVGKRTKIYLNKGLYAGQPPKSLDWFGGSKGEELKKQHQIAPFRPNGILPMPMWHGQRLLHVGRNFKLPFDVCAPLPPGQAKPDEWKKTSTNRFIGEAGALWKKTKLFDSFSSKCVCTPEGGCDVDCQNRIMLYECDDTNCGAGRGHCTNRAFADLAERRKGGGKYRIGVEVIKTEDRGYGVRSNRCFDPHQIIVEYTGEIITEDECDRRMNEDYKNNECYYLMSFDQNMIIDATKGSIARFVNHSCKPNSRMVKWIVGGKPRMALFAGDSPIMSGDELTYDYNFDPFSAKNVQECRCGSDNCRGVLGPKPKDVKPIKETIKDTVKGAVKAGKRKLKELLGDDGDSDDPSPKKRMIKEPKGLKRSASSATLNVSKGVKAVKRSMSTSLLNARQAVSTKRTTSVRTAKTPLTFGKTQTKLASKNSKLMIAGGDDETEVVLEKKQSLAKNVVRDSKGGKPLTQLRAASESTIKVVSAAK